MTDRASPISANTPPITAVPKAEEKREAGASSRGPEARRPERWYALANLPPEPQQKSLEDIRREIDAEFAPAETADAESDLPVTVAARPKTASADRPVDRLVPRRYLDDDEAEDEAHHQFAAKLQRSRWDRSPRRRGYIVAGVIGCIAGQLLILAFVVATRYRLVPRAAEVSAPPSTVGSATVPSPVATPAPAATASTIAEPLPSGAPSPTVVAPESSAPTTPAPPSAVAPAPPAPPAAAADIPPRVAQRRSPPPPEATDLPRRVEQQPSPAPAPTAAKPPSLPLDDWAESQAQLRVALREWLATSGLRDDSLASDAVVILRPDGRTASTQVPIRRGGGVIVREQRWERQANIWRLVEDREAGQAR